MPEDHAPPRQCRTVPPEMIFRGVSATGRDERRRRDVARTRAAARPLRVRPAARAANPGGAGDFAAARYTGRSIYEASTGIWALAERHADACSGGQNPGMSTGG